MGYLIPKIKKLNNVSMQRIPKYFYNYINLEQNHKLFKSSFFNEMEIAKSIDYDLPETTDKNEIINYFDISNWLTEESNSKLDKASMLNSIEARVPFQDKQLIQDYFNVNMNNKIDLFNLKKPLKNLKFLPKYITNRKKRGWFSPESFFLRNYLKKLFMDTFEENKINKQRIFNFTQIMNTYEMHNNGKYHKDKLITISTFQIWYDQVINLRFYVGISILLILTSYQYFFSYTENFMNLSILSFIVYLSWINEINLAIHEKNRSSLIIKIFLIVSVLFYFLLIANFLSEGDKLSFILKFYLLFHALFFVYHINFLNLNIRKFIQYFKNQFEEYLAVASSFFNIIGVIIWRISLVMLLGKSIAGLFFASFAIASFPGTLFNNIVGQIVTINQKLKELIYKISNVLFVLYIILISFLILLNQIYFKDFQFFNFFHITLVSLFGTPFMLRALSNRHEFLSFSKKSQKKIFIKDILYGISISPIIIILFYIDGKDFLIYSYPISSFLALFYYRKIK